MPSDIGANYTAFPDWLRSSREWFSKTAYGKTPKESLPNLAPYTTFDYFSTSPEFITGFTRYAKWLATELKGSVHHWEVWNEWNGGLGLPCGYKKPPCNDVKAYVKLLCPVYAAVKQVDPSIVVIGGAAATQGKSRMRDNSYGSVRGVLRNRHPYRDYTLAVPLEEKGRLFFFYLKGPKSPRL